MACFYEALELKSGGFQMTVSSDDEGWVATCPCCYDHTHETKVAAEQCYCDWRIKHRRVAQLSDSARHCSRCHQWTDRCLDLGLQIISVCEACSQHDEEECNKALKRS